ncbi:MAG: glycosyltransferase family 1 protein, partial [Bdellovibrionales bacterium]|nr:glycosyltransferase family 1 protein [Bdellovibrionales bacterium]
DIIFCLSPFIYINNNFIVELLSKLTKRVKLVAWYGANCGNEEIFRKFDLTLSNSKHLVNSLKEKGVKSKFLQHSFDVDILNNVNIARRKKQSISFFGNLCVDKDFHDRTKMIMNIRSNIDCFDIFAETQRPKKYCEYKHLFLKFRHKSSSYLKKLLPNLNINNWDDEKILPKDPWILDKNFTKKVMNPLYGKEMFEKLSHYSMSFNKHNDHTGDVACNMRMFETTGMGSLLVTDNKRDISDYFSPDDEVVVYNSTSEAIEKINFLIDNPNVVESISKKGMKRCHHDHNSEIVNSRIFEIFSDLV